METSLTKPGMLCLQGKEEIWLGVHLGLHGRGWSKGVGIPAMIPWVEREGQKSDTAISITIYP